MKIEEVLSPRARVDMIVHHVFDCSISEREFQRRFAGELVQLGFYVDKISDVPGASNSLGFDLHVVSPDGVNFYIEVKKRRTKKQYGARQLADLLEPSQRLKRISVRAYRRENLRYLVVLLLADRVIVEDVTDLL